MKYDRIYNFSAGPAMMPEPVLEEIRDEMLNYQGSGMCVMEMSHRSKVYQQIIDEAEQDLRDLMNIPDNYKVLFIQGGATLQFAMIPMNLMKNGVACYVETGAWSKKAIAPWLRPPPPRGGPRRPRPRTASQPTRRSGRTCSSVRRRPTRPPSRSWEKRA